MPSKAAATQSYDPRIDAYFEKARPFAQPILMHIRALIHKAVPDVTETVKWSHVFFEYKGRALAATAAFKEHCTLGFWAREMRDVLREHDLLGDDAMGGMLRRITSTKDLPGDKKLLLLFRIAAAQIDEGNYTSPMAGRAARAAKPAPATPPDFAKALKANKAAAKVFAEFSPSCKREYIDWITEAKREETRTRRLAQAVEMIAEGKQRNWKYQAR